MMMHDAIMKSYYISVGEMNMDWIEVKATCMWCMLKVILILTSPTNHYHTTSTRY